MTKYFMKGTKDELHFGDTVELNLRKELEDGSVKHTYTECVFMPMLVPLLLENDVIEEVETEEDEETTTHGCCCCNNWEETIEEIIEEHEELEKRIEKLEEFAKIVNKETEEILNLTTELVNKLCKPEPKNGKKSAGK